VRDEERCPCRGKAGVECERLLRERDGARALASASARRAAVYARSAGSDAVVTWSSGGALLTERSDSPIPRRSLRPTCSTAPINSVSSFATALAVSATPPPFVAMTRAVI
jgi:hypothetical protein